MPLSPEHRAKLLANTRNQAVAFLDDLQHLRAICGRSDLSGPELRRASSVLRRLIVESDITAVAAPRLGRLEFLMPDNQGYYDAAAIAPLAYFASGGMMSFGFYLRAILIDMNRHLREITITKDAFATVAGRLDNFRSQRVICRDGTWATRADVIKYVANVASGVHSQTPRTPIDEMLSLVHRSVWYTRDAQTPFAVTFDLHALQLIAEPVFRYSPTEIDPTLLEIFSAINYMMISPNIIALEESIKKELSAP